MTEIRNSTDTPEDLFPVIESRECLAEVSDEALGILLKDPSSGLYVRAGMLVRVVRDNARKIRGLSREPGQPVIEPVPLAWLRDRLGRAMRWVRITKDDVQRPVLVPKWVAENIISRDELPFPQLEGVIEAPTLRRDGSLLDQPGYDEATGLLFEPAHRFPEIQISPSATEVEAAKARLLDLFTDFPFVAASDKSACFAAILTAAARHAINGPAPMFAIRATAPGSGKTLIADIISLLATGRPSAKMVAGKDDDETRKLILSIGLEGASVVLLDNIEGALGSSAFAAALTSTTFADRLLGVSKRVTVSLSSVTWLATGNNLTFKGDLGRRVVPIDLDAGVEHPEDRTDFKYPGLLVHVRAHRTSLLADALTCLRGYYDAGMPEHGKARMGSFESWDTIIRSCCIWLLLGDPIAGRERIREEGDQELESLRAAHAAWTTVFETSSVTMRGVIERAAADPELRDALTMLSGRKELTARGLGYALRRFKGRLADGFRFEVDGISAGQMRWKVTHLNGQGKLPLTE